MIRLGTVAAHQGTQTASHLAQLLPLGFESFEIAFKNTLGGVDLARLADEVAGVFAEAAAAASPALRSPLEAPVISCLGIYGNTLAENEHGAEVRRILRHMIEMAPRFGTDLVCCFAGRVTGASIPESIPRFREVFAELADFAGERGIRLAFENCLQGGAWQAGDRNIAHNPAAWELMFEAVPSPVLGLEWEPAHQLIQLIDPVPQLREWAPRIFHIHGKDAEIHRDVLARSGAYGAERFAFYRFPGLGESHWARIISTLTAAGFRGSIDIEGCHDPVYRGDLEMAGQLFALKHLRSCRAE